LSHRYKVSQLIVATSLQRTWNQTRWSAWKKSWLLSKLIYT